VFSKSKVSKFYVSLFDPAEKAMIETQIQNLGAEVLQSFDRSLLIQSQDSLINQISNIRGIEFIEHPQKMESMIITLDSETIPPTETKPPLTEMTGFETGTKIMNFDAAWALGITGKGQIAAMADTGLDSGAIATISADFAGAVVNGHNFGLGATNWNDPMGHGTHVGGSIVGRGALSQGKIRGGAYEAGFVPQSMWSPIIDNLTVPPQLSKLFETAYADGARVHSNSWGSGRNPGAYDSMAAQVDEYMHKNQDFLVVFAAGNSGVDRNADGVIDPNSMASPGTAKNALTVGASENLESSGGIQKFIRELRSAPQSWPSEPISSSKVSDNENGIAMFSSRGPTADGRIKPDIVAPGTNILSARSHVKGSDLLWGEYNQDYLWCGGTSMATPLASAAATVTRQFVETLGIKPSAAMVKGILLATAKDLYPGQYGQGTATQELKTQRPNNDQGYGRVDVAQILTLTKDSVIDYTEGLATGQVFEKEISLKAGQKLVALLAYTDAPGSPAAAKALVNNLDLQITDQEGQTMALGDSVNNVEILEKTAQTEESLKVSVKAVDVPMGSVGKQSFALVLMVK
jgi:hypothetical protein